MPKRSSKDENEIAFNIVQKVTAETPAKEPAKNPYAVALGRLGGLKGGKARAEKLSARRRKKKNIVIVTVKSAAFEIQFIGKLGNTR